MIKKLLNEIENQFIRALFGYVDDKLDDYGKRIDKLEETDRQVSRDLERVQSVIDSDTETRKTIKKAVVTAIVTGIVGYILTQLGLIF
ncbi:hypothetical protein [Staphylococcus equorum]|uniref:hypothetical protein n=1 Tax=Staphylococcus equorum TaxID=246432 RepID=UPI00192CFAFF|nr:hypothetical protein [Staphylococcus equorum]